MVTEHRETPSDHAPAFDLARRAMPFVDTSFAMNCVFTTRHQSRTMQRGWWRR